MVKPSYFFDFLGDNALLLRIKEKNFSKVDLIAIINKIREDLLKVKNQYKFLDIIPTTNSLVIYYDNAYYFQSGISKPFEYIVRNIKKYIVFSSLDVKKENKSIEIPVLYHDFINNDLKEISDKLGVTIEDIIKIHTNTHYTVHMYGFAPGFAYIGDTDIRIRIPRKDSHLPIVRWGSVAIANEYTAIYPFDMPGGWYILGRTPIRSIDYKKPEKKIFEIGMKVKFFSINRSEFLNY